MEKQKLLSLYKAILSAARRFPSKKRDSIVKEVQYEFRVNKTESDKEKVLQQINIAIKGLGQLSMYSDLPKNASDWSVNLETTPMPKPKEESEADKKIKRQIESKMKSN